VCGNPASTDLCRVIEESSDGKYAKVFSSVIYSIIYGNWPHAMSVRRFKKKFRAQDSPLQGS
jgi:hypothetical protein